MKLDVLYEVDVPKPWPGPHPHGQRQAEQQAYREALEQIKLADKLGFHTAWHVEHHFREGRSHSPAPEVIIGALSQCTEQIRLGFGVTLMPHAFTPPMRVAEKVATADVLSNGRVEWGTGRSTPMEQIAFGVDREASREQWQEAIQAVVGMWESEYFEYHGKYLDFPKRMVTPKPVQDPHPPCWMAATSDGSAAVAGKLGLGLLSFSILQPIQKMAKHIAAIPRAAANPTPITRVTTNKVAAYTLVHCAETMAKCEENGIWDSVWWWYKNLAEFTLEWEFPHFTQEEKDKIFPLLEDAAGRRFRPQDLQRRRHDRGRRSRPVPREDAEVRRARRRPAHLLRAGQRLDRRIAVEEVRRDARRHELGADHGGGQVERIGAQLGNGRGVEVAREHHQVVGDRPDRLDDQFALGGVTIPRIGQDDRRLGPADEAGTRHEHLLGDDVPDRSGVGDLVDEPVALHAAEHRLGGGRRELLVAHLDVVAERLDERLSTLLVGAVLAGVEHVEPEQIAVGERAVDRVVGARRRFEAHRHVLVPRLVGRGAPGQERVARIVVLADLTGVVVVDLVVVPRDDPRHTGVGRLEEWVAVVQRVALAVLIERLALEVLAGGTRESAAAGGLVDVVAEEHERVDGLLLDEIAVRRVAAVPQFWHDENAKRNRSGIVPGAANVFARPGVLSKPATRNR